MHLGMPNITLCSRNFQNVKLRFDFVEKSFYRHLDFTGNQILVNLNGPKLLILTIFEILNFEFSIIRATFKSQIYQKFKVQSLKLPKMTFLDRLNSPKFDFT